MSDSANKFLRTLSERGINFSKVDEPVETFVEVITTMPEKVQAVGKEMGYTTVKVDSTGRESKVYLMLNF